MAEADRAINEILAGDNQQEKQSKRISHYESVKSELMGTLKKVDEDEQNASDEMTEMYAKYGIASWDFDTVFEFRDRRKKAWDDYGTFLQKEKASLDKAKQSLMEQQENAEKLEKMRTVEGYLDVALDEWLSIHLFGVKWEPRIVPSNLPRGSMSLLTSRIGLSATCSNGSRRAAREPKSMRQAKTLMTTSKHQEQRTTR